MALSPLPLGPCLWCFRHGDSVSPLANSLVLFFALLELVLQSLWRFRPCHWVHICGAFAAAIRPIALAFSSQPLGQCLWCIRHSHWIHVFGAFATAIRPIALALSPLPLGASPWCLCHSHSALHLALSPITCHFLRKPKNRSSPTDFNTSYRYIPPMNTNGMTCKRPVITKPPGVIFFSTPVMIFFSVPHVVICLMGS